MSLLLTYFTPFSNVSFVDFKQVNISWDGFTLCFKLFSGWQRIIAL